MRCSFFIGIETLNGLCCLTKGQLAILIFIYVSNRYRFLANLLRSIRIKIHIWENCLLFFWSLIFCAWITWLNDFGIRLCIKTIFLFIPILNDRQTLPFAILLHSKMTWLNSHLSSLTLLWTHSHFLDHHGIADLWHLEISLWYYPIISVYSGNRCSLRIWDIIFLYKSNIWKIGLPSVVSNQ